MTTADLDASPAQAPHLHCGCCGRTMPAGKLAELGTTPGVYICAGCALWAARRAAHWPSLHRIAYALRRAPGRLRRQHHSGSITSAIPILPSTDLNRTSLYWRALGFDVVERHDGYLVTHADGVEMHFAHDPDADQPSTGTGTGAPLVFLHVQDAAAFWKRLMADQVTGIGPVQDQDYGLREFIVTDPDGNRLRIGSPIHD